MSCLYLIIYKSFRIDSKLASLVFNLEKSFHRFGFNNLAEF
jgi:hypothetical protein